MGGDGPYLSAGTRQSHLSLEVGSLIIVEEFRKNLIERIILIGMLREFHENFYLNVAWISGIYYTKF
jgi:hypothetical protein